MPRTRKTTPQADTPNTDAEVELEETTEEVTETTEADAPETISAKDLAARLNTDPKSFRRWLRRHTDNRAGKGGRWTFSDEEADALMTAYNAKPAADSEENEDEAADA